MNLEKRIADAEATSAEMQRRRREASQRILARLSDAELDALAGPTEAWDGMTDAEIEAVARGEAPGPEGAEYEPPAWIRERLAEIATPEELRLSGWAEVVSG